MNDTQRFTLFRKDLLRWFAENRRPLPWRADYTPYRTWIAEVMMQQTQMDRGVQYFLRWMERFPDVAAVAAAPEEDLLKACLLYTSPSPRDMRRSRMPSSA